MSVELKRNSGMFFVPFSGYGEKKEPLWSIGFSVYEIIEYNKNHFYLGYDEESASHWGDIAVDLYIRNNRIVLKGKGSRRFREDIINAFEWFKKAKNDVRYIELFHPLWFEEPNR